MYRTNPIDCPLFFSNEYCKYFDADKLSLGKRRELATWCCDNYEIIK